MQFFDLDIVLAWSVPLGITILLTTLAFWALNHLVPPQASRRLYRQLAQVGLFIVANIFLVLVLPFESETRGQLLSLFGLVLTAVIALSSTTFVSNAMAGLTLKTIGSFHTGDFIRVADHFGRVTTKTLLHTEIQSEDRDTITLPNLFVITNPVQVVDQSGTLISATCSIGFDVHRHVVRDALLKAAEAAELADPFVQILDIGNFAVEYKITGFLESVDKIVSKRTELRGKMLDALHDANIEVMTPNVMNQRPIGPEAVLPRAQSPADGDADTASGKAERIMFDKAAFAARVQRFRDQCDSLRAEIEELTDVDAEGNRLEIAWRENQLKAIEDFITRIENEQG